MKKIKVLIAQMEHETNTFSPVLTPWESFGPNGPYVGQDAYDAMKGTKTPIGAFIDIADELGAEAAWADCWACDLGLFDDWSAVLPLLSN
jgi:microcystin degradation protein MlrC